MSSVTEGVRALHYVQDEIRRLYAVKERGWLTKDFGEHSLSIFTDMLKRVWGKEYRDGEFVFIKEHDGVENLR